MCNYRGYRHLYVLYSDYICTSFIIFFGHILIFFSLRADSASRREQNSPWVGSLWQTADGTVPLLSILLMFPVSYPAFIYVFISRYVYNIRSKSVFQFALTFLSTCIYLIWRKLFLFLIFVSVHWVKSYSITFFNIQLNNKMLPWGFIRVMKMATLQKNT